MRREVSAQSAEGGVIAEEDGILKDTLRRLVDFLEQRTSRFAQKQQSAYQKAREALFDLRELIGEAKSFDLGALTEQMHNVAALANAADPDLSVPADPNSPYFAHIRLDENNKQRDVLIGKRSFVDAHNKINIVDWRNAPVSRLYYTCDEGSDYDIRYGAREVEGRLLLRRALSISNGILRRIQTPQVNYLRDENGRWFEQTRQSAPTLHGGQGKAKRAPNERPRLGGSSHPSAYKIDKHLPEIAALIDPEQFERITQPQAGLVILQGGAGSGKTTVALHRVAYLNYLNRNLFSGDKVLIVVFNRALARYIEKVLPSLEVFGIRVWTYYQWTHALRRQLLPHLPKKEWTDVPSAVARLKKHPAMLAITARYINEQVAAVDADFRRRFNPKLLEVWDKFKDRPLLPRLRKVAAFADAHGAGAAEDLSLKAALARAKDVYADWSEIITDGTRLRAGLLAYGDESFSERRMNECMQYTAKQVLETPEIDAEEARAAAAHEERYEEVADGEPEGDQTGLLDIHDNTILLRLAQLKFGGIVLPNDREIFYHHAAVDEAQDLSPLEIQVVLTATQEESVTLAGDTAQKLVFDNGFESWDHLLRALGRSAIQLEPLKIGYRSTAEINDFARAVLGPLAPSEALKSTRSGAPVEVFQFEETGEAVAFLGSALRDLTERERMANIAVLTLLPQTADLYYEALRVSEIHPLRRVRDQEFTFTAGVDVTDISQVKGLEYDYVIVVDANFDNFPNTAEARHLLHIAATRAAHQLWLIVTGAPSPIVPQDFIANT